MPKTKYVFNPQSLHYERARTGIGLIMLRAFGFLSASLVFAAVVIWVAYTYLDSPKEKQLKNEIAVYELELKGMEARLTELNSRLDDLAKRDDDIYRVIFEADPLPAEAREAGIGGVQAARFKNLSYAELLNTVNEKLDVVSAKMNVQKSSFEELSKLAARKSLFLSNIPAIQPIANKNLTRMASGYGMRIHPIYKTLKMHTGMDFTAPIGTDVVVTGNGTVEEVTRDGGYGLHVVVNHGFGYRSLYAHLGKVTVKTGEKVSRGQTIGKVGSSGLSTAPHLHYEIMKGKNKINPINFYFNDLTPEEYERICQMAENANQSFD